MQELHLTVVEEFIVKFFFMIVNRVYFRENTTFGFMLCW